MNMDRPVEIVIPTATTAVGVLYMNVHHLIGCDTMMSIAANNRLKQQRSRLRRFLAPIAPIAHLWLLHRATVALCVDPAGYRYAYSIGRHHPCLASVLSPGPLRAGLSICAGKCSTHWCWLTTTRRVLSFPPFLSRMEEKTSSHPLTSSSSSRATLFALLGVTLLLAVGTAKINWFDLMATGTRSSSNPAAASDHGPASPSCDKDSDPMVWRGPTCETGDKMEDSRGNSKVGGVRTTHIPFFGSADDDAMSKSWSHLNHRVEEYRDDLVKVVEVSRLCLSELP